MRNAKILLLALLASPVTLFAGPSDDATEDYEEQDRRYFERHVETEPDRETDTAAFLARADELIRDANYRSASGAHYRVQTDDPRVDAAAVAAFLDSFRVYFDEFWSGRVELLPYRRESRAFLFHSLYKFNQLLVGDWRRRGARPQGHYRPEFDAITVHTDPGGEASLAYAASWLLVHFLLHGDEGVHAATFARWLASGARGADAEDVLLGELDLTARGLAAAASQHARQSSAR